ncbi:MULTISPECIES: type II toxin-antitoxin system death-on-curing family toxin [unclassified Actinomyces]|uniref:type II toxin-antitoxin system death-on-curing family toxin n=1 Tax=unclassified Actinomyces TaxID=2609248 RepID=UPI001373E439|nr:MULTISPECIES: type II toxin-antitoxin system death-on-curing family toxin [unclassified Actinomyces]MBW3070013.1 type II toxin-antitoxin system death-on-curing family toxin [Actinomyces sp. 594]NDR54337.1 type II toxin-antitoxin system death-on-curing family toxin [Actinomyces sp. 565]QHO92040.1 type II toxin-antitoxin system death-on-curing family toxin [Actinomyces sp. 432]
MSEDIESEDPADAIYRFALCYHEREFGSRYAIIGDDKLRSACGRPFHTFGGEVLFPTLAGRAAALLDAINQAHAFTDGNKRTAWMCLVYFLARSGYSIRADDAEAEALVLAVVKGDVELDFVSSWIAARLSVRRSQ